MDRHFTRSEDFVQRTVAGECLLVPIRRRLTDTNSIYVLNETGAEVWQRLDGTRSVRDIAADLLAAYEVATERLDQDVKGLIDDLLSIEAIHEVPR